MYRKNSQDPGDAWSLMRNSSGAPEAPVPKYSAGQRAYLFFFTNFTKSSYALTVSYLNS